MRRLDAGVRCTVVAYIVVGKNDDVSVGCELAHYLRDGGQVPAIHCRNRGPPGCRCTHGNRRHTFADQHTGRAANLPERIEPAARLAAGQEILVPVRVRVDRSDCLHSSLCVEQRDQQRIGPSALRPCAASNVRPEAHPL